MRKLILTLFLILPQFVTASSFSSGGTPEGTAVKSTGVGAGLVLTAQGDNSSAWSSVAGTGDFVGPAASVDSELVLFSGTSGKLGKRASGTGLCKATSGVASFATLVNADVNAAAAIAYSKLSLTGSIVNADVNASAAIAYSKLNLGTSIVNADVNASAAIALSKLAALTVSRALVSDGSGVVAPATTTATEIGYVNGVTSAIQTQLNAKLPTTGVGLVEVLTGHLEAPTDKIYVLDQKAAFAYTINLLDIATVSGTTTAAVKINGTNVTGISAVSVSSTPATGTASAANSVSAGDKVTLVLSSSATPVDMSFTLKYTR